MDRREAILVRLLQVLEGIDGFAKTARNRVDASERSRPAGYLHDADEAADDDTFGRGRPASGPNIVGMTPEIYLLVSGDAEDIGTLLNVFRAKVVKAVLSDETLIALCVDGDIRYEGCATGLALGRSMDGEMALSFTFNYVLNPTDL